MGTDSPGGTRHHTTSSPVLGRAPETAMGVDGRSPQTLSQTGMSKNVVYAIVKAGGRQEKVSVGDIVVVDRLSGDVGDAVEFTPVLVVDGNEVTTDAEKLGKVKASARCSWTERGRKLSSART